jgi:hypothetical protein
MAFWPFLRCWRCLHLDTAAATRRLAMLGRARLRAELGSMASGLLSLIQNSAGPLCPMRRTARAGVQTGGRTSGAPYAPA